MRLGIGAARWKDPKGVLLAWKQNQDFEALLRRLNDGAGSGIRDEKGVEGERLVVSRGDEDNKRWTKATPRKTKRRKSGRKRRFSMTPLHRRHRIRPRSTLSFFDPWRVYLLLLDVMDLFIELRCICSSHRAGHIASKHLASKSASAISEILGMAHTMPSSPLPQNMQRPGTLTQLDDDHTLEKLTYLY